MRREPNDIEIAAAGRLKRAYNSVRKEQGLTYAKLAESIGKSTGLVAQYLNADVPLNINILLRICSQMKGINAKDIYPELFEDIGMKNTKLVEESDEDFLERFRSLDAGMQEAIRSMIDLNLKD